MSQNYNNTLSNGGFADQARSVDDRLTGCVQPVHHENEEARHQGNNSSGSDTVGGEMRHQGDHESNSDTAEEEARHREDHDSGSNTVRGYFPTQEHPSAPEPLVRQLLSDQQNLPHQAVVTVQLSPPRPLHQTVAEDLSRAADSLQTNIELLRAAAESLEATVPTPAISSESSTEQQPNDNPQEQTQQSSAQAFANLLTSPQTSTAHCTPANRPKPTTATRPYRSHK